jgi:hypothetical protein
MTPILRKLYLIAVATLAAMPVLSQSFHGTNLPKFDSRRYHFGFHLGFNTSDYFVDRQPNYNFEDSLLSVNTDNQPGFNLGIVAALNLNKNISLRFTPTLSFQERLLNYVFYADAETRERFAKRVESTFIEFPVNFKFRTDRLRNVAVYALAGGKYLIDMQSERDVKNELAEDIIVKTEKNDFALEFGGGFDFFLQYFKFGIELKMAVGLTNVLVNDGTQFSDPIRSLRTRTFMISFTFEG